MKRLLAFVLALSLVLALAGCAECTHEYQCKTTIENCDEGGTKTYTCIHCNDSYTENVGAAEHSMKGWTVVQKATDFTPGQEKNECANCSYAEERQNYSRMFYHYAEMLPWLPGFENPGQLQEFAGESNVISAAVFGGVKTEVVSKEDEYPMVTKITVADMNEFTTKCFGMTYDYTGVDGLYVLFESKCSYDAETDALYIRAAGAGDEMSTLENVEYTTEDHVHFVVTSNWINPDGEPFAATFTVEKQGENYAMTSN